MSELRSSAELVGAIRRRVSTNRIMPELSEEEAIALVDEWAQRLGEHRCISHAAYNPEGDCVFCDHEMAKGEAAGLRETVKALADARDRVQALCERRQWDMASLPRLGAMCAEAAELCEAVRGKHGDTLHESANCLFTLLAASPHGLPEILAEMNRQIDALWDAPEYKGEERRPSSERRRS